MRGVLVGAAPRAARNRNTAKCGVKRLRGARGAPPTSEGKSTYFIAGAIVCTRVKWVHVHYVQEVNRRIRRRETPRLRQVRKQDLEAEAVRLAC